MSLCAFQRALYMLKKYKKNWYMFSDPYVTYSVAEMSQEHASLDWKVRPAPDYHFWVGHVPIFLVTKVNGCIDPPHLLLSHISPT